MGNIYGNINMYTPSKYWCFTIAYCHLHTFTNMIWLLPVQKSLERPKIHQAVLGVAALLFVGPQFLLVSQASSPVDQTAKLFEPGI